MNEDEVVADAADDETAADAHVDTNSMSAEEMRAELERWRNTANEAIETRQRTKEKNRNYEQENRELKKALAEKEKAEVAARREKLAKKESYDELIREVEEERQKLHTQIGSQLKNKQFEDLYRKVVDEGGLDPSNEFVIRATLSKIAGDLELIEEVDPSDIANLTFREADKKSVAAALRQLRKLAPGFFSKSADGGDVASQNKDKPLPGKSLAGFDASDPEVQRAIRLARG